jgi:hypothetical protein
MGKRILGWLAGVGVTLCMLIVIVFSVLPMQRVVTLAASPQATVVTHETAVAYLRMFGKYRAATSDSEVTLLDLALSLGTPYMADPPDVALIRSIKVAKIIIDNGFDVNSPDKNGCTALQTVVVAGEVAQAGFLLKHGADYTIENPVAVFEICRPSPWEVTQDAIHRYQNLLSDGKKVDVPDELIHRRLADYERIKELMMSNR